MNNEVTKGSNGQMNYTSGQGGGFWSYIDSLPLRYVVNRFYTGEYVADLEEENKTLKFQLQELNQANVNLFNKNQELERKNKYISNEEIQRLNSVIRRYEQADKSRTEYYSVSLNCDSLENKIRVLNEQLEIKEIINQDLTKKYEQLEQVHNDYIERLSNLTVHTNELEYKYKELQGKYNSLQEYAKNSSNNLFKVNLQHRVKPYLSEGVINVIVESNKELNR